MVFGSFLHGGEAKAFFRWILQEALEMLLSGGPPTPQGHPLSDYHYTGNQSRACSFTDRRCHPLNCHVKHLWLNK